MSTPNAEHATGATMSCTYLTVKAIDLPALPGAKTLLVRTGEEMSEVDCNGFAWREVLSVDPDLDEPGTVSLSMPSDGRIYANDEEVQVLLLGGPLSEPEADERWHPFHVAVCEVLADHGSLEAGFDEHDAATAVLDRLREMGMRLPVSQDGQMAP